MTWLVIVLLAAGIFLSALFSGSETGFYRVTRVRLLLDGLGGDRIARMLLRLTNHPALFVATTLIGNNVANYITSLGIVLGTSLVMADSPVVETIAPMVFSPLVFVYCELLPKQLFFHAPNRLLRRAGPLLLLFTGLFAPLALVLWSLGWLLGRLLGQTPLRVRLTLASKELQQVLREGEEAGILHPAQRDLAQQLLVHASKNVARFIIPLGRVMSVPQGAAADEALAVARRQKSAIVPIRQRRGRELIGYVRAIDLMIGSDRHVETYRVLPRLSRNDSYLAALIALRKAKADVALVEGRHGHPIGLLYAGPLTEKLLGG